MTDQPQKPTDPLGHQFVPEPPGVPDGNPYKGKDHCWAITAGAQWTIADPEYCRRPRREHA